MGNGGACETSKGGGEPEEKRGDVADFFFINYRPIIFMPRNNTVEALKNRHNPVRHTKRVRRTATKGVPKKRFPSAQFPVDSPIVHEKGGSLLEHCIRGCMKVTYLLWRIETQNDRTIPAWPTPSRPCHFVPNCSTTAKSLSCTPVSQPQG